MIDKNIAAQKIPNLCHEYSESTSYRCGVCKGSFTIHSEFREKTHCPYCGSYQEAYSCGDFRLLIGKTTK